MFKERMSVGRLGLHQAGVVNGDLASVTCYDVVPRNAHRFIRWQTKKDTPPAVSLFACFKILSDKTIQLRNDVLPDGCVRVAHIELSFRGQKEDGCGLRIGTSTCIRYAQ